MKRYCDGSTKHHGAALLTAMLTVVLVASLASAMLWQQWRGVEIEAAQRTRVQSAWILTGALDWARLILREDARQGGADHLAEPWAIALAPARLSTFLAAQQGQTVVADSSEGVEEAFLSGHIEDLQARLNVSNLLVNGKPVLFEPRKVIELTTSQILIPVFTKLFCLSFNFIGSWPLRTTRAIVSE